MINKSRVNLIGKYSPNQINKEEKEIQKENNNKTEIEQNTGGIFLLNNLYNNNNDKPKILTSVDISLSNIEYNIKYFEEYKTK